MYVKHNCELPTVKHLPRGISFYVDRWRCPVCGIYFKMNTSALAQEGLRYNPYPFLFNFKNWKWQRRIKRDIRR